MILSSACQPWRADQPGLMPESAAAKWSATPMIVKLAPASFVQFGRLATISSPSPTFALAAAHSEGQGWAAGPIAQRLVLDGHEHGGRLARSAGGREVPTMDSEAEFAISRRGCRAAELYSVDLSGSEP